MKRLYWVTYQVRQERRKECWVKFWTGVEETKVLGRVMSNRGNRKRVVVGFEREDEEWTKDCLARLSGRKGKVKWKEEKDGNVKGESKME